MGTAGSRELENLSKTQHWINSIHYDPKWTGHARSNRPCQVGSSLVWYTAGFESGYGKQRLIIHRKMMSQPEVA
jgi:hypothetical protein